MNEHDLTVVTVTTGAPVQDYYTYPQFFESLRRYGVEPLVLKAIQDVNWSGLGSKPKILYKAIKDGLIETRKLLFVDCWDLVFVDSPYRLGMVSDQIYTSQFVISAEKNCFPSDLKDEYDKLDIHSPYKYLNSGLIYADTEAMLTVLEAMELNNVPEDYRMENGQMCHINDQFLYQQIFLKQPIPMKLDHAQILCKTMHDVSLDELDLSDPMVIRNKSTGFSTHSIHLNGGSKTSGVREPILKHLNLL